MDILNGINENEIENQSGDEDIICESVTTPTDIVEDWILEFDDVVVQNEVFDPDQKLTNLLVSWGLGQVKTKMDGKMWFFLFIFFFILKGIK